MDVELYAGSIDGPLGDDGHVLSHAELVLVTQLRRPRDRRAYIAGRSIVRRRLSLDGTVPFSDVPLRIEPRGRPTSPVGPCFSIAHAGHLVVVAFAPYAVGVDVEPLTTVHDVDLLIDLYGSPSECTALRTLPRPQRDWAFLTTWVRKEAVAKACGTGITGDLTQLDARLDVVEAEGQRWRVVTLPNLHAGYVAAVSVAETIESTLTVRVLPAIFAQVGEAAS